MEFFPKCPNCGTELELDDVLDMDYDDESISLFCIGGCPKCGKSYQWYNVALFRDWSTEDLKEN